MILGVDHIAFSATSVEEGVFTLASLGYEPKFIDRGVENPPSKKPLLAAYRAKHDIAYCQALDRMAIEVTVHGPLAKASSHPGFLPIFSGDIPISTSDWCNGDERLREAIGACFHSDASIGVNSELATPVGILKKSGAAVLAGLVVPVLDVARASDFWRTAFRITLAKSGEGWQLGAFSSPVPAWSLPILLIEVEEARSSTFLDSSGFRCVAVLSNDFGRDLERACLAGASDVASFELSVGGRRLDAAIFRTPDGNLAEIIQIPVSK